MLSAADNTAVTRLPPPPKESDQPHHCIALNMRSEETPPVCVDTHIAGVFLSLLCKIITRSDHCWEAAFAPLMLKIFSIGNLQEMIHFD